MKDPRGRHESSNASNPRVRRRARTDLGTRLSRKRHSCLIQPRAARSRTSTWARIGPSAATWHSTPSSDQFFGFARFRPGIPLVKVHRAVGGANVAGGAEGPGSVRSSGGGRSMTDVAIPDKAVSDGTDIAGP